jgi:thioredoxin-related protein
LTNPVFKQLNSAFMRNSFLVLLLLIGGVSYAGESKVKFVEATWQQTVAQAGENGKMVFLDCYTDWCYWCKVMDKETFTDTSVSNLLNSRFVPAKREMEKSEEGRALNMKYHVSGYPTYLIFDGTGQLMYQIVGSRTAHEFRKELLAALEAKAPLCPGFSTTLDPGFPEFLKDSYGTSKERKKSDPKEVNAWLDQQSDLTSEVCWAVLCRFSVSEKYENWIFENKAKLTELYGAEQVKEKTIGIIYARVDRAAEKKDESAFQSAVALVAEHAAEDSAWHNMRLSLTYYEKTEDWKNYAAVVQNDISKNGYANSASINGSAWLIYESCNDKEVVAQAAGWMENVCKNTDEYAYEDTYAALLYKKGDYAKAEEAALHAIDLGKKADEDVSATEALLANIRLKRK